MTVIKDAAHSTNSRVSLGLKCGQCIHLTGVPTFERPCIQLGKTTFADACPSFTPDMVQISVVKKNHMAALANITLGMSRPQLGIFAYVFRNIDHIKKARCQFGEQVVFSLGGDFLECYVRGFIIGADRTGSQVYISSDFEGMNVESAMLTLLRTSIMTMVEFAKHRKSLIANNRLVEPKFDKGSRKRTTLQRLKMTADERSIYRELLKTKPDEYVPPSLDTVPARWLDERTVESLVDSRTQKGGKRDTINSGSTSSSGKASKEGFKIQRYSDKKSGGGRTSTRKG
jgi:hypothetical protein